MAVRQHDNIFIPNSCYSAFDICLALQSLKAVFMPLSITTQPVQCIVMTGIDAEDLPESGKKPQNLQDKFGSKSSPYPVTTADVPLSKAKSGLVAYKSNWLHRVASRCGCFDLLEYEQSVALNETSLNNLKKRSCLFNDQSINHSAIDRLLSAQFKARNQIVTHRIPFHEMLNLSMSFSIVCFSVS